MSAEKRAAHVESLIARLLRGHTTAADGFECPDGLVLEEMVLKESAGLKYDCDKSPACPDGRHATQYFLVQKGHQAESHALLRRLARGEDAHHNAAVTPRGLPKVLASSPSRADCA
jgi:hypothetical protein